MPDEFVANSPQAHPPLEVAALSIAGSDSSGGAGIQADLKTFAALGVYGATAVTAVTAQNTVAVTRVETLAAQMVEAQILACLEDLPIRAIKTGMLASSSLIEAVAAALAEARDAVLIVDPVMVATSGARLLDEQAVDALIRHLLPAADLVTPNRPEAAALGGGNPNDDAQDLARRILDRGARAVLIKDGHGAGETCRDWLVTASGSVEFARPRLSGRYHGTGCALSAAICAYMARGDTLNEAVARAGDWLAGQLERARLPRSGTLALLPFTQDPAQTGH